MRSTGGVIAVATVFAAVQVVQAFVAPPCTCSQSAWRVGAASRQHQQQEEYTCSVIDSRGFRRTSTRVPSRSVARAKRVVTDEEERGSEVNDPMPSSSIVEERQEKQQLQKRRWEGARRCFAKGAASLATLTFGATALSGLSADLQHRLNRGDGAGTMVSIPTAMKSAEASIFKSFDKRTVEEKLGNLPAFMVTNSRGSPYLSPTDPDEPQLAVFFTNLADAKEMLREMVQSSSYAKDARILVVSMEKAYNMVKMGPRPTGYLRQDGIEETMDFKLERDMHSFAKARRLGLDVSLAGAKMDIPIFYAEGLEVKRDGGMVKPLFMDPADLVAAWKKAVASNPAMPESPTVKVFNMPDVMVAMELTEEFNQFGFFASTESAEYIQQAREAQKPIPKPRLGRMWSF